MPNWPAGVQRMARRGSRRTRSGSWLGRWNSPVLNNFSVSGVNMVPKIWGVFHPRLAIPKARGRAFATGGGTLLHAGLPRKAVVGAVMRVKNEAKVFEV